METQAIEDLKDFVRVQHVYNSAVKEITTKIEILDDEFHSRFDHNPIHHIESRIKSPMSIAKKLEKSGFPVSLESATENLYDIAGVRIICHYIDDVYNVATMLLDQSDITLIRIKDYIKEPKPNGYRSLHLTVSIPVFLSTGVKPTAVEIQIRTIAMDFWASLDHELRYKAKGGAKGSAKRLKVCADEIARLDKEMQSIRSESIE